MGQRIQIVFKVPETYYYESNPNNNPEGLLVYHNQWLYGKSFVKYASRLIHALEYLITEEDGARINWERIVAQAVNYADYSDITNMTESFPLSGSVRPREYFNNLLKESGSALGFLEKFDNNNGYIFIEATPKGEIGIGILNGYEDAEEIKQRDPEEYVKLFYTEDKYADDEKLMECISRIRQRREVPVLVALEKLRKNLLKTTEENPQPEPSPQVSGSADPTIVLEKLRGENDG